MENIGLNSDIQAGGKSFHIQTQYLEPSEKIVSSVFENGRVLTSKSLMINDATEIQDLKATVNRLHRDMSVEIELLFFISEKVRTIKHAISNNKLGLVFLKKNLYDEAIKEFKNALEIDPNFAEVYNNLGLAYLKKNMLQQARDVFSEATKKNSEYADFHNNLGLTYFLLNNFEETIVELEKALTINPEYIDAQYNLCALYLKSIVEDVQETSFPSKIERLNKVKELLDNIICENNFKYNSKQLNTVLRLLEENNYAEAMKNLESAHQDVNFGSEPDFENEFYLNFMFGGKGKDDNYIFEYSKKLNDTINQFPDFPDLRNHLGIAYLIQCRNLFLSALEEFRHALKLNPNYKKAEKNLKLAENDGKGFLILLRAILK